MSDPVDIVVVSYRRPDLLLRCCATVRAADHPTRLVVVDNDSGDAGAEAVRAEFPEAVVLENPRNLGFAAAVNIGAAVGEAPWVLLLNNDAELRPGALGALLEALRADPGAAGAGPRILHAEGHLELSVGRTMSPWNEARFKALEWLYADGRGPAAGHVRRRYRHRRRARSLTAACLLLRRRAWRQVGGMDEDFFLYAEDVDLCRRLTDRGWHLLYVPEAVVTHLRGASSDVDPVAAESAYRRSQLRLYDKHHGRLARELLRLYLGLRYGLGWLLARGPVRERRRRLLRVCLRYRPRSEAP